MAWTLLLLAAILEVGWAIGLKYTYGFTKLWPSVGTILAMILSMCLLAWAARTLPIGTAYAVWTGIGAVGTAALGVYLFGEAVTPARLTVPMALRGSTNPAESPPRQQRSLWPIRTITRFAPSISRPVKSEPSRLKV